MRNRIGSYLEQQILSATPLELIHISYQSAIQAVRDARRFLAERNIMERSRSIVLAHSILAELYRALDFKAGDGSLSRELGRLYDYMMRRLLEANAKQIDEPLGEVVTILSSLSEAWQEAAKSSQTVPAPVPSGSTGSWAPAFVEAQESHYSFSF